MNTKEKLLEKYDGGNQDTKREIIKHLYNNPDMEHEPETIFEAISDDCRASKVGTVANQLSELSKKEDSIGKQKRFFYRWNGQGRRRPNRRLQNVRISISQWLDSLNISFGTAIMAFIIWALGMVSAVGSLIALFISDPFLGISFILWFHVAGLLTILGSSVVMIWLPLYLFDVVSAK